MLNQNKKPKTLQLTELRQRCAHAGTIPTTHRLHLIKLASQIDLELADFRICNMHTDA